MTLKKTERDAEIVQRYVAGDSLHELTKTYKITRARIYQILRQAGVDRVRLSEGRDEFLGANVPEAVKDALRVEAARRGVSMSSLTSDMLSDMLKACGYTMEASK